MSSFVGRKNELAILNELLQRKTASFVVVKGRRRIGKSRLIEEFAKDHNYGVISGVPPCKGITAQHQRDEFAQQMARVFAMPVVSATDWSDLFWHLAQQTQKNRVIILLDEISWMGSKDPGFLGKLKNAWDLHFKKNPKLILVLCGSVSSWVEKNILSSTGFVGRIDLTLTLEELSLAECNQFWGAQKHQVSAYEKCKVLAVMGGVPRYLELMNSKHSAEQAIKQLCFLKEGFLFREFEQIFHDLFGRRKGAYQKILTCLIKHPQVSLPEIFALLGVPKSGVIAEYLNDLVMAGFVARDFTWSLKTGELSKLSHFRVSDNYVRFYLKYIAPNKANIERNAYADRSLTTLPGWDAIMALQFENLVLRNRAALCQLLRIEPSEIVYDNPYFQRNSMKQAGCQIDYMIHTRFNCVYVCEIKFSRLPVKAQVVDEVKQKIKALSLPRNFSYRPVLIHVNGVEDELVGTEFFAKIIDFGALLEQS